MKSIIDKWPIIIDRVTTITIIGWIALTVHEMSIQQARQIEQNKGLIQRIDKQDIRIHDLERYHRERTPRGPDQLSHLPKHIIKPDQRLDPKRAIRLVSKP